MKEDNTYYNGMEGPNLPESLRGNPFVVPGNYFPELTKKLQQQSKLASYLTEKQPPWDVPEGYFDKLSDQILAQAKLENSAANTSAFDVPADYFDSLSDRVHANLFAERLKEQYPVDGFSTPAGYTDTLQAKIKARTIDNEAKQTPVRRLNFRALIRYAAAACIIGAIGFFAYNNINEEPRQQFSEPLLSAIPEEEIINYLSASNESEDMLYIMECMDHSHPHDSDGICSQVKEDDIEDYLNYAL